MGEKKWTSDLRPPQLHPAPVTSSRSSFPPRFLFSPSLSHLSRLKRLPVQLRILDLLPSLWKLQALWPEGTQPGRHPPKTSALFPRPLQLPGFWGLGDTVGLSGSRVLGKLTRKASTHGVRRAVVGKVL